MEDVLRKYFQAWIDKDIEIVKRTFSENVYIVNVTALNIMV